MNISPEIVIQKTISEYYGFKYLINTNNWRLNDKINYPNEASIATQGLPQSEITFADLPKKKVTAQELSENGI